MHILVYAVVTPLLSGKFLQEISCDARAFQQSTIRPRRVPVHSTQKDALLLISSGAEAGVEDIGMRPEFEWHAKNFNNIPSHGLARLFRIFYKWRKLVERLHFLAGIGRNQGESSID